MIYWFVNISLRFNWRGSKEVGSSIGTIGVEDENVWVSRIDTSKTSSTKKLLWVLHKCD